MNRLFSILHGWAQKEEAEAPVKIMICLLCLSNPCVIIKVRNEHDSHLKRKENAMIKAQYIAIADTGEYHSIYAIDLEEAIKIFRYRNIHGKCKQIGTELWIDI